MNIIQAKTAVRAKPTSNKSDVAVKDISDSSALPLDGVLSTNPESHCGCKHCRREISPPRCPVNNTNNYCGSCKTNYRYFGSPQRMQFGTNIKRKTNNIILGFHVSRKEQAKKWCLSKFWGKKQKPFRIPVELYKMDAEAQDDHSPPRVIYFSKPLTIKLINNFRD